LFYGQTFTFVKLKWSSTIFKVMTFVNRVPLDRDGKNNKTDTFVKIKSSRSLPEWRLARKALALTAKTGK